MATVSVWLVVPLKCSHISQGLGEVKPLRLSHKHQGFVPIVPFKLSHIGQLLWTGYEHQLLNHLIHGRYPHDSVHLCCLSPASHDPHLQQVLIVGVPQSPQADLGTGEAAALGVEVQRHQTLQVYQKLELHGTGIAAELAQSPRPGIDAATGLLRYLAFDSCTIGGPVLAHEPMSAASVQCSILFSVMQEPER